VESQVSRVSRVSKEIKEVNITSPDGEPADAGKFMRNYNENEHYKEPTVNANTGELEEDEKKENQNKAWVDFRVFWLKLWRDNRGFEPEISLVADKSTFHRQYKLRGRDEVRKIAEYYFTLEKSHKYPSITACFSADTLNQWKNRESQKTIIIGHG